MGRTRAEAPAKTGLAAGARLMGDAAHFIVEMMSTGAGTEGEVTVNYGTTLCLTAFSRRAIRLGPGLADTLQHHPNLSQFYPGLHAVGGGIATSGALTRWFRDQFCSVESIAARNKFVDLVSVYPLFGPEALLSSSFG